LLVALGDKAGQPVASSAAPVAASQSALVRSQPVTQSALIDTQRVAQNQSQYQAQPGMASTPTVAPSPVPRQAGVVRVSGNMGGAYFNSVKGVDFRRGKEGQGEFLVTLDNSSAAVDVSSRGQKVLAKFHGTRVPMISSTSSMCRTLLPRSLRWRCSARAMTPCSSSR
jgi:type IV pilus assembly protein PilQ